VAELVKKLALPLYVAVIVSDPRASIVVVKVATPPDNCAPPRDFVPDLNDTDPVGVPEPLGVIVTVKVTDWPNVDGFLDDVRDAVVDALFTT
jgi:hypothetical protein